MLKCKETILIGHLKGEVRFDILTAEVTIGK